MNALAVTADLLTTPRNTILVGDCVAMMRTLPPDWFHTVVTSPPYWGLRDYGIPPRTWEDGTQCVYGLEESPELFVAHTVEIFRDVRRILRGDGVLWLNFGDSYAQDKKWGGQTGGKHAKGLHGTTGIGRNRHRTGQLPGTQCLMPHRIALAMQEDGWFLRSTIVWAKRSPMPESLSGWRWVPCRKKVANGTQSKRMIDGGKEVQTFSDPKNGHTLAKWQQCPGCKKCESTEGMVLRRGKWRPTTGHEYVFLFSKREQYFCDGDAVQEMATCANLERDSKVRGEFNGKNQLPGKEAFRAITETRNPRSVWTFSSEPYKGAHFATFPTALPRRCIEAATSAAGCCPRCGSCYAPVVNSERVATRPGTDCKVGKRDEAIEAGTRPGRPSDPNIVGNRDPQRHVAVRRVTGYLPTCRCQLENDPPVPSLPVPCRVFDLFGGSGTTAQVAAHLGREWVITEVNPVYAELARERIAKPLREPGKKSPKRPRKKSPNERQLFSME